MRYFDFTVLIGPNDSGGYLVHAESERFGEPDPIPFVMPDEATVEGIRDRFENRNTDREYLESIGQDLYRRVIAGKINDTFLLSLGEVRNNSDLGLRIRFRIGVPEAAALPWELLYSQLDEAFIGTRIETPLVRYLDMPSKISDFATPFPLRLLVLIPRGGDSSTRLDVDVEKSVIQRAVAGFGEKVKVTYLNELFDDRRVTWPRIAECVAEQKFNCVHFIGHGAFHREHGYVILDGEDSKDDPVEDERFANLFVNSTTIRLVVLNACKGATLSSSQPLAGSAARLVRRGVPAVVAMQFSVYDEAAVAFARSFYHSLFGSDNRGRVEVAVSRGRQSLAANFADQRELAAPVLFMHTKDALLFVPEEEGLIRNLPKNSAQLDTLAVAREATSSEAEAAKFARRIKIAQRSVQIGIGVGLLVFFLSTIQVLDFFTIDTRAEFAVMAFGNGLADHSISKDLKIITVAGRGLSTNELRERIGDAISAVGKAGAKVVGLDVFYPAEQGTFRTNPASGQRLVDTIRMASIPVVIGAIDVTGDLLDAPESLHSVVAGVGYLCHESKLGLTRSLPITASVSGAVYPSFALASYAAFTDGRVLTGAHANVNRPTIIYPDRPSAEFEIAELNDVRRKTRTCPLIGDGDRAAHRFIRLSPEELLRTAVMTNAELQQRLTEEPRFAGEELRGKLVLVGILGRGDIISDLAGPRDGVMWQADAINNLLLDDTIVPVRNVYQLLLMLVLAGIAVTVRLQVADRRVVQNTVIGAFTVIIVVFSVYFYGRHGLLLNPVYLLLAVWVAWWVAAKFGKKWLTD